MADQSWRRRIVVDMLFDIDGSGWHGAELREAGGFRWSGPGHLSILRVPMPASAGRGRAQCLLVEPDSPPDVTLFLNGHRLATRLQRSGSIAMLDFAWDAAAMADASRAEFWFHCAALQHLPAAQQGMRAVGFRLSTLTVELADDGPAAPARDALALAAGHAFLDHVLPVGTGRARLAFLADGAARRLDMRMDAARLGPSAQPQLNLTLRDDGSMLNVALSAPGSPSVQARLDGSGQLDLAAPTGLRDRLLVARLLASLPKAYGSWLDEAMHRAAPDAALLADWRRAIGRLALAAEAWLAARLAEEPEVFALDRSAGFAWG